jgi:hypothetical protein
VRKFLILFGFLGVILTSYLIYSYSKKVFAKTKIDVHLEQKNIITFLISGLDSDNKTALSLFVFLEPTQKKCGLFFINPLTVFEKDGKTIEDMQEDSISYLIPHLESITGLKVNYSFIITQKDFVKAINLIGGISYYLDPTVASMEGEYKRGVGDFQMYGRELVDYLKLTENPTPEDYLNRLNKQESIVLTIYDKIREIPEFKKEWVILFEKTVKSELTGLELYSIFQFVNKNHLIFAISELPVEPMVQEKTKKNVLLAKSEIASVSFAKLKNYLQVEDYKFGELSRSEVLNATEKNGLAKDVKSILNEKQYKVLAIGNGWSKTTEKESMVVDRSGNSEISYRIANTLNIKKVRHIIDKELGLDASVLLGEDFEIKSRK